MSVRLEKKVVMTETVVDERVSICDRCGVEATSQWRSKPFNWGLLVLDAESLALPAAMAPGSSRDLCATCVTEVVIEIRDHPNTNAPSAIAEADKKAALAKLNKAAAEIAAPTPQRLELAVESVEAGPPLDPPPAPDGTFVSAGTIAGGTFVSAGTIAGAGPLDDGDLMNLPEEDLDAKQPTAAEVYKQHEADTRPVPLPDWGKKKKK